MLWMILIGSAAALSCGLVGCYLVLRRVSLLGDAISHAVLPGIALAFLLTDQRTGPPVIIGAMALGVLTSFLTTSIHRIGNVPEDASMGVVFTSLFAVGVILMTNAARNVDLDVSCVLYGNLIFSTIDSSAFLGLGWPRVFWNLLLILAVTIGFVSLFWKELKITSFDPALATALGLNVALVHFLLMALVAGVTVASFEAVGSILVIAMLIVPGATAHLMSDRLRGMLAWSAVVAVLSAVFGVVAAVRFNAEPAGMIAVASGVLFAIAVFLSPRHGLIRRWLRRMKLSQRIRAEDVLAGLYRLEEARQSGSGRERARRRIERDRGGIRGWFALRSLRRHGWVVGDGTVARLTDSGRERAKSLVRGHRLWEAYLKRELELPLDHLHDSAELVEHYLDAGLRDEIESEVKSEGTDPHGRPIPGG